jgi:CBS-domain-containing membrane protein
MEHAHVRRLPVVDPDGRVVGIVSATDLAMKAQELDSETLVPKIAHHVPKKTSAKFLTWM